MSLLHQIHHPTQYSGSVKIPGKTNPSDVEEAAPVEVEATPADESAPQLK